MVGQFTTDARLPHPLLLIRARVASAPAIRPSMPAWDSPRSRHYHPEAALLYRSTMENVRPQLAGPVVGVRPCWRWNASYRRASEAIAFDLVVRWSSVARY